MSGRIIDGTAVAAGLTARIAGEVAALTRNHGFAPGLAVVLVGDNPASTIYVRNKVRRTAESGMRSFDHRLEGKKCLIYRRADDDSALGFRGVP